VIKVLAYYLQGGVDIGIDGWPLDEWIGSACAILALTVVYGYFIKARCRMLILST
jgi:hypothetical protein|tara:strand:+ start:243 stop:407 length:165 start_codon:yes stop_codon:yes gene_type:complete